MQSSPIQHMPSDTASHHLHRSKTWLAIWVIAIALVIIIVQPFSLYFLNDDFIYVSKSTGLNYLYRTAFRPMSDLTLLLNRAISGTESWSFHLTNLLIHGLATRLVFLFTKRWLVLQQLPHVILTANIAALLFWCYPFHSESIFWIIGRGGSMVTVFFLGAMLCIMHQKNGMKHWLGAALLFVAGMLTYESSWLLPLAIGAWLLYFHKRFHLIPTTDNVGWILLFALLLLSFIIRHALIGDFIGSPYLNTTHFEINPAKNLYKIATGFFRSFLPPMASSAYFVAGSALVVLVLFLVFRKAFSKNSFRENNAFLFLLFLLCLAPVFILAIHTHTTESERFLYLPSAFLCMWMASWLVQQVDRHRLKIWVSAIVIFMLFFLYSASEPYKLASQWTKTTMLAMAQRQGTYHKIIAFNVPTNYKGGFIFRLGLEEGIRWLAPGISFDTLIIQSAETVITKQPLQIGNADSIPPANNEVSDEGKKILQLYWKDQYLYISEK